MAFSSRVALLGLLAFAGTACSQAPLEVSHVDLGRMEGRWYEIASIPRSSQAGCTGTTANYERKSASELLVVNQCHQGTLTGPLRTVAGRAVVTDAEQPGKLSLNFGGFYGDYWVIEVGEQYEYLVVGHPSRDYLWIMSRSTQLPAATLQGVLARAQKNGFPTGILSYTKQE